MMYMHYCQHCQHLHMLNGHKLICPACQFDLTELKLSYLTYVEMDSKERQYLVERLNTADGLKEMATTYRMLKYSKLHKQQNIKLL